MFAIGPLSPIPFALITNNCIGWTTYSILSHNYYIFSSNCFIMILSFVMCLTAIHILERSDRKQNPRDAIVRLRVEGILVCSASFWLCVIFVIGLILYEPQYTAFNLNLVGSLANVGTLVFYAAPLINISEIFREEDSSSLYAPAIIINLISSILWFFYGFLGVKQMILWISSAVGLVICLFQLYLCWLYPTVLNEDFDNFKEEEFPSSDFTVFDSSILMLSSRNLFAGIAPTNQQSIRNIPTDQNIPRSSSYSQRNLHGKTHKSKSNFYSLKDGSFITESEDIEKNIPGNHLPGIIETATDSTVTSGTASRDELYTDEGASVEVVKELESEENEVESVEEPRAPYLSRDNRRFIPKAISIRNSSFRSSL